MAEAAIEVASHIAINPFVDHHPVCLRVSIVVSEDKVSVVDANGDAFGLVADFDPWNMAALVGTNMVTIFGELGDLGELGEGAFRPLTVEIDGELVPL